MLQSLFPPVSAARLTVCWTRGICGASAEAGLEAERLLRAARDTHDALTEACCACLIAWFCFQEGQVERGLEQVALARQLWRLEGSLRGEAAAGALNAWLLLDAGLPDEASEEAVQALALAETDRDPAILAFAINVLGVVFWVCQQIDRALPLCEVAVTLAERVGDPVPLAWWRVNLAGVHSEFGYRALRTQDAIAAQSCLSRAIAINQLALDGAARAGDPWCELLTLCNAAEYLSAAGRIDEALAHLERCRRFASLTSARSAAHHLYTRADVLIRAGRLAEALAPCRESLRISERTKNAEQKAHALKHLSEIQEGLGDYACALQTFKQFFATHQVLAAENTQRRARIAEIRYDTGRLRRMAKDAEEHVANLVRTVRLDPLTGIANRRAVDEVLATLTDRGQTYALAMIDLDHFKTVNDRFSHAVGDQVLKQVAGILSGICRLNDLAARLGGEEFTLVLDGVDMTGAVWICESIQHAFAATDWARISPGLRVTASIGVAASVEDEGPAAVLALADLRLYRAKNTGRDRIVFEGETDRQHGKMLLTA